MDTAWSEIQVKTLLNLIAPHPCLYDTYFAVYFTFQERHRLFEEICEKLKVLRPAVTVNLIKKKMNSLRRQFNQQMKMVREARDHGKEYKPDLWCFEDLKFLQGSESIKQSAEVVIISDSGGQTDGEENNHVQGNPAKKVKTARILNDMEPPENQANDDQAHTKHFNPKRKRKIPVNGESKKYLNSHSGRKLNSCECKINNSYEGDIEDGTVRSEKMPRPNIMFFITYFQSLFSGETYNSNNEYLLSNTTGYSNCFGTKCDAALPEVYELNESDHTSCLTGMNTEMFKEEPDCEEFSDEKVAFVTWFLEEANNYLDGDFLRGEYYLIDTSNHVIHLQAKKMREKNIEQISETKVYHKYKYMNLALPIFKSAKYLRLCPETIENDSYLQGADTSNGSMERMFPCISRRSTQDKFNANMDLEYSNNLNRSGIADEVQTAQIRHSDLLSMDIDNIEKSLVSKHDFNALCKIANVELNTTFANGIPTHNWFQNFGSRQSEIGYENRATGIGVGLLSKNVNDLIPNYQNIQTEDSDSEHESICEKYPHMISQQKVKYFIDVKTGNFHHRYTPPAANWLDQKPHCSKSQSYNVLNKLLSRDYSSGGVYADCTEPKMPRQENTLFNSIEKNYVEKGNHFVQEKSSGGNDNAMPVNGPFTGPPDPIASSSPTRQSYNNDFPHNKGLDNIVVNENVNEVEILKAESDYNIREEAEINYSDSESDDGENSFNRHFNNSFLHSDMSSTRDSGNGDDSVFSECSYETETD